jgi:hypothetical protein
LMTCVSELIFICSSSTSPHSGALNHARAHIRVILRKAADVARVIVMINTLRPHEPCCLRSRTCFVSQTPSAILE